ncbi:MAG: glycosyltransferase family 4 protein [Lachnospiraceae bacterium]|nr:glycosyltransferase family 4 protein [Lachnospiraceae bacterium]
MLKFLFLFQKFSFKESTIYLDLVRECALAGHEVYVLAGTSEEVDDTVIHDVDGCHVAYVTLPDQFGCGKIKKGLIQLLIEPRFLHVIYQHFWKKEIDLIVCPTPPITMAGVIAKAKKHYNCKAYLMLKDIFPQNAADLKMMSESSIIFKYFKFIEKKLYSTCEFIGCMSEANVEYMKKHNPAFSDRLEIFPNTVSIKDLNPDPQPGVKSSAAVESSASAGLKDKVRFIIGGNLGQPQALDFILDGISALDKEGFTDAYFTIIGKGTMAQYVEDRIRDEKLSNAVYMSHLGRDEYEKMLDEQDVGILSLCRDFTIPNFPSRLLSYMQKSKPILAVTDKVTDIGKVITKDARCGYFTPSDDLKGFVDTVKKICNEKEELPALGRRGREFLIKNYDVKLSVKLLERSMFSNQT